MKKTLVRVHILVHFVIGREMKQFQILINRGCFYMVIFSYMEIWFAYAWVEEKLFVRYSIQWFNFTNLVILFKVQNSIGIFVLVYFVICKNNKYIQSNKGFCM